MTWRIRFKVAGGHVHCRLYCAPEANRTFAWCGDFTVYSEEFANLQRSFQVAQYIDDSEPAKVA